MNKKILHPFLKSLGLNILGGLLISAPLLFMKKSDSVIGWLLIMIAVAILSLLTQLIIAIVYSMSESKKETGQGMLLSVGVFILIGIAVCGPMWF